jgi:hypothetical protein
MDPLWRIIKGKWKISTHFSDINVLLANWAVKNASMNIKVEHVNNEIGRFTSDLIIEEINRKLNLLLCMASGDTPTITCTKQVDKKDLYRSDLIPLIRLDEWGGLPLKINC